MAHHEVVGLVKQALSQPQVRTWAPVLAPLETAGADAFWFVSLDSPDIWVVLAVDSRQASIHRPAVEDSRSQARHNLFER